MATSRLAAHLPSLFGPSRRATWRLSILRRGLAAGALLLALHLTLGAARPATGAAPSSSTATGPALTLPLAAPADHLDPGDAVGIYLPGQADPVVTGARVLATPQASAAQAAVRVALQSRDVGPLVQQMTRDDGRDTGFVVVREE